MLIIRCRKKILLPHLPSNKNDITDGDDTDTRPAASWDTDKSVECQYPQWQNCKVHFVYVMNPKLGKITMCNCIDVLVIKCFLRI